MKRKMGERSKKNEKRNREEKQAVYFHNHRVDINTEAVVLFKIQFLIHHITLYASNVIYLCALGLLENSANR